MPLVLIAAGGAGAYCLLRCRDADAARAASDAASASATSGVAPGGRPSSPVATKPQISVTAPQRPEVEPPARRQPLTLSGRWGWPVPQWQGRAPVISDRFRAARADHDGVDIMFARLASDPFAVGTVNGTSRFVMPDHWVGVAASDGVLWSSGHTKRGYAVVVDHGPVATFYTHFDTLLVPEVTPPSKRLHSDHLISIKAGQPLGVIGKDPLDVGGVKHLHFELWNGGPGDAVDPEPYMTSWEVFTPQRVSLQFPELLRNARRRRRKEEPDLVFVHEYWRTKPGRRARP
jgi:murein DD-endopeptidase MepM/ murein hydrolase activator NlpD